ncbi:MAG TPA: hypothetical protein RMH99_24995 [Sandaracinaceae bacterium LLY-WYZ-13_1]|nr:hypothetical protein [Sandaracinaceae bacterium LLY-WYZ-13_1]
MSDRERYPLEAVQTVRAEARREAERALADAIAALEKAQAAHERASASLRQFRVDENERAALERQRLRRCSAGELQREEAFQARQRARDAELAVELARARKSERAAATAVETARQRLGRRAAESEAVSRHADRWRADRAKAADERAEDERDEVAAARRTRKA